MLIQDMTAPRPAARQTFLRFPNGWGGRRRGAGRKPKGERAGVSHDRRPELGGRHPVHVTLRMAPPVWNLRSRRAFRVVGAALGAAAERFGLHICAFSVQGNHVHLVAEAADRRALSRGMQGLGVRLAKGMNRLMGRRGRVLGDRFHARALRTPAETRRALAYVMGNRARHQARWARPGSARWAAPPDPFSSAAPGQGVVLPAPRTYLLRRARGEVAEEAGA
jgi:REP element-mobilizing transposase RayT